MIVIDCDYEPEHTHEYPDDWDLGGASGLDPRADPRWRPQTFVYLDGQLREVWRTSAYLCLDQAIDAFTLHSEVGATFLQVKLDSGELELADWQYDCASDTVFPLGGVAS